jgi:hypothetical protein
MPQRHCCKQCGLQVNKGEENICSLDVIDEEQKGIILAYVPNSLYCEESCPNRELTAA